MTTVSLDAAKALKAAGMEQEGLMWWVAHVYSKDGEIQEWRLQLHGKVYPRTAWHNNLHILPIERCAAPDPLTALAWLETNKGWHWKREYNSYWKGCRQLELEPDWEATWEGDADWGDREFDHDFWTEKADTPDSLVIQICGRLDAMGGQR